MTGRTFTTRGTVEVVENLDLDECHTTPIHHTALIQPHGALLEVDPETRTVRSASENVGRYLDGEPNDLLGRSIGRVFDSETVERLEEWLGEPSRTPERFTVDGPDNPCSVTLVPVGENVGIELEIDPEDDGDQEDLIARTNEDIVRLGSFRAEQLLFEHAVRTIREITGFDRVMLYRFDSRGHGKVVAESKISRMDSYLNHKFPASDIPESARRLYRKNMIRYIPATEYDPVPVLGPGEKRTAEELDLTHSSLRNVPLVHRRYLENMGVGSSMSVSLVVQGELWGLIACHGLQPRELSGDRRNVCKIVGNTVAQQINWLRANRRKERQRTVDRFRDELYGPWVSFEELFDRMRENKDRLLSPLDSNGFYLQFDRESAWIAREDCAAPPEELLAEVRSRLEDSPTAVVSSIRDELDPGWERSESLSGFLAARLGHSPRAYCVWFRPEEVTTVKWGGDPRRPAAVDEEGKLTPRRSFESWSQKVVERCSEWEDLDEFTAREIVRSINELALEIQYHRLQEANVELQEANREKSELIDRVEELARTDELTGLPNRRHLMEQFESELERARRYGTPLSFLLLDLDRFKRVNDQYGHGMGDEVLREMGNVLRSQTRDSDVLGRYGGEEFAVILPETPLADARVTAERILDRLRNNSFDCDGDQFVVTASGGLAERRDSDDEPGKLINRADEFLYRAKENGRDRVVARR